MWWGGVGWGVRSGDGKPGEGAIPELQDLAQALPSKRERQDSSSPMQRGNPFYYRTGLKPAPFTSDMLATRARRPANTQR